MKKAANGGGTVERRGSLWWVQVSLPRAPGAKLQRRRVPIAGSRELAQAKGAKAHDGA